MNILLALLVPLFAQASWHYNEDGGFGIYQPEGWSVVHNGRSSRLIGPENDSDQSDIFLGSDWVSKVTNISQLEVYALENSGADHAEKVTISGLEGFRTGSAEHGNFYVLRIPENVIVVEYELKGSRAQVAEGQTMIGSIEIRVKGIEHLKKTLF